MDRNLKSLIDNVYLLITAIVVSNLNKGIKDFFTSGIVMFMVFTLYNYQKNNNIMVSMATAFALVILVTLVTVDSSLMSEAFTIITPTSNTKLGCENIKLQDLLDKYKTKEALQHAMFEALVPNNLYLTDENAPEIATYLATTTRSKISDTC
jgi:hypothetical protein